MVLACAATPSQVPSSVVPTPVSSPDSSSTLGTPENTLRPGTPEVPGGSVVEIDTTTGEIRRVIVVREDPLLLTEADGYLWTMNSGDGSLSRIDPAGDDQAVTIELEGEPPAAIGSDGEDLWVAANGNELVRLDGETGREEQRLTLGSKRLFRLRDAGFLAIAQGSIWVTIPVLGIGDAPQSLWRVDPSSGEVLDKIPIDRDPLPLYSNAGVVFVLSLPGQLARIDPVTNVATTTRLGGTPGGMVAAAGSLWVGFDSRDIVELDPLTLERIGRIETNEPVRGIAAQDGTLWAATESSVLRVDPTSHEIVAQVRLIADPRRDFGPIGMVVHGTSLWVSVE